MSGSIFRVCDGCGKTVEGRTQPKGKVTCYLCRREQMRENYRIKHTVLNDPNSVY